MVLANFTLLEEFWEEFEFDHEDIEILYTHLLEVETPMSSQELIEVVVEERIQRERKDAERQRSEGGRAYLPKDTYEEGEKVVFPSLGWQSGVVENLRPAKSFSEDEFKVITVLFDEGIKREFAAGLETHKLNEPVEINDDDPLINAKSVLISYGDKIADLLIEELQENDDFVYIAGRWFPRALLVDVNLGNLNLAEAILDMAAGKPLPTYELIPHVNMPEGVNPKLAEFSLDLALQEDERFDEVGSAGKVLWYLKRLEPKEVQDTPVYLRYKQLDYEKSLMTEQMLEIEKRLDDELSDIDEFVGEVSKCDLNLIFPHWRTGTLPLSPRLKKLFPTAYESPRVRFMLVDGETGEKFPGWVVRLGKYVYGLRQWYLDKGVMPGSKIYLKRGENPGEVIVNTESHRSTREWVRTALIGADGGVVYATLKQQVETAFDDWMMVYMPDNIEPLDQVWKENQKTPPVFEQIVADALRELTKLNPQAHVHVAELYSAINVEFRCPPGPIMALLASRPWFVHVGDLHFRIEDTED